MIPEKWDEDLKCTVSTIINAQVYVRGGVRHDVHVLLRVEILSHIMRVRMSGL